MSGSNPVTPGSGKSIYFDAPITHESDPDVASDKQMSDPNEKSPADNQGAIHTTTSESTDPIVTSNADTRKEEEDTIGALEEKDHAPAYTAPGPDEKLSRSYLPTDFKFPHSKTGAPKHNKPKASSADSDNQTVSTERDPHPSSPSDQAKRTTSVTSRRSGRVPSPSSIPGTSGHVREEGSAFENGAAITGPNAQPEVDESVHFRAATAETGLSAKTKSKLSKTERKEGKRLSKIIKAESKAEKKALEESIKQLSSLQSQQTAAVKREAKASSSHTKALKLHHQTESRYLKLKAEYEQNLLNAQNMEEAFERERRNCREIMERTTEKAREVEKLRVMYGTDERERQAKLIELNQRKSESRFALSNML